MPPNTISTLSASTGPGQAGVDFAFTGPGHPVRGRICADLSGLALGLDAAEQDLIASAALIVLAGMFLPERIAPAWDSRAMRQGGAAELLRLLYEVRAYCAKTDFFFPEVAAGLPGPRAGNAPDPRPAPGRGLAPGADTLVLFSGGIDSTWSLVRLLENGTRPAALFLGLNTDTRDLEQAAARRIAAALGVGLLHCDFQVAGLPARGADPCIWPQFGQFPFYNSIPHGRDILSAAVAWVLARREGLDAIAFGQEKESRIKKVRYRGRDILRHDVESREGMGVLHAWLERSLPSGIGLCSALDDLRIEDIRLEMLTRRPDLLAMTQSCVWERRCGRCIKCVSLYTLQRASGVEAASFAHNPLADPGNEDLAVLVDLAVPDNEIGYGGQIRSSIRKIIARGSYTREDYWILRAAENAAFLSPGREAATSGARPGRCAAAGHTPPAPQGPGA